MSVPAAMRAVGRLNVANTALFLCDMQEKFAEQVKHFPAIVDTSARMLKVASTLKIPTIATEQYPKGLGRTVPGLPLKEHNVPIFEKTCFSMLVPALEEHLKKEGAGEIKSVILCGIEAHACIFQTAMDLISKQYDVHLIVDACSSRSMLDRVYAFRRLEKVGAYLTTSECAILQLLKDAAHPDFRTIQKLIMESTDYTGYTLIVNKLKSIALCEAMSTLVVFGKSSIDKTIVLNSLQSFISQEPLEGCRLWKHEPCIPDGISYARLLRHPASVYSCGPNSRDETSDTCEPDPHQNTPEIFTLISCWGFPRLGDLTDHTLLTQVASETVLETGHTQYLLECGISSFRGILVLEYGVSKKRQHSKSGKLAFTDFEDNQVILALEDTFGPLVWNSIVVAIIALTPISQTLEKFVKKQKHKNPRFGHLCELVNNKVIILEMIHCNVVTGLPCQKMKDLLELIRTVPSYSNTELDQMQTFMSVRNGVRLAASHLGKSARTLVWIFRQSILFKELDLMEPEFKDMELSVQKYGEYFQPATKTSGFAWSSRIERLKALNGTGKNQAGAKLTALGNCMDFLECLGYRLELLSCEPCLTPSVILQRLTFLS